MDGIDAALIETDGQTIINKIAALSFNYQHEFRLLLKLAEFCAKETKGNIKQAKEDFNILKLKYPDFLELKDQLASYLYGNSKTEINLEDIILHSSKLHAQIALELLETENLSSRDIDLVGYHGQALYHNPKIGITLQVGDGNFLAHYLGINVIDNFRENDVKNGGQGAPLAPIYHQALAIRDNIYPIIVLNCGGIANFTYIKGTKEEDILGFDTGPGNVLIDAYIRHKTNNKETFDKDGKYGLKGKVNEKIMAILYHKSTLRDGENYFELPYPKSLDSSNFFLIKELDDLNIEDAAATIEAFTAKIIVETIKKLNITIPKKWILAGGGWNNPVITSKLKEYLGDDYQVISASVLGWDEKDMEAELFAYLAVRSYLNLPISFPSTTNVKKALSGGKLHLTKELNLN